MRQLADEREALEQDNLKSRVELQEAQRELRLVEQRAKDKQARHDEVLSAMQVSVARRLDECVRSESRTCERTEFYMVVCVRKGSPIIHL